MRFPQLHSLGVQFIEIHTGPYALAEDELARNREFSIVQQAAEYADSLGLKVNAGHGLHYHNTTRVAALPHIQWLHTGHSIISQAVLIGMELAV